MKNTCDLCGKVTDKTLMDAADAVYCLNCWDLFADVLIPGDGNENLDEIGSAEEIWELEDLDRERRVDCTTSIMDGRKFG